MAEITVSQVASKINENNGIMSANPISFIEENGEILFTSEEIGRHLGYRKPRQSVNLIYNKNQKKLDSYSSVIAMMTEQGVSRKVRVFTEEGVYILSMLAQTPNAREFRSRVAVMLRELRSSRFQHQLSLATESAHRQGYAEGRASALPDLLEAEQKARLDAARLLWRFGPERKRRLRSAVRYRRMGLGIHDIAKLLDVHNREISTLLKAAEALGELPRWRQGPALPVQGSLFDPAPSTAEAGKEVGA